MTPTRPNIPGLCSGNPEDTPLGEVMQVGEIDVCLVKDHDLAFAQALAEGQGMHRVVLRGFLHHGKGLKKGLQIQA